MYETRLFTMVGSHGQVHVLPTQARPACSSPGVLRSLELHHHHHHAVRAEETEPCSRVVGSISDLGWELLWRFAVITAILEC
ncbi:hypothetical protein A5N71_00540 [Prescottella equi]|nr:hypothetical protein A5N71_00540 [Prescottella equi]